MYNDKNIKFLISLIKKYKKRTKENLIWRGSKMNISKKEVINSLDLLIDLNVITTITEEVGDGWNTRGKSEFYILT